MPISASLIAQCLRPQFVWDNKCTGKWLLANAGRDVFFQKDLGILVFINLANIYECPADEVRFLIAVDPTNFTFYTEKLDTILRYSGQSEFEMWRRKQVYTKTGLVKNILLINHGVKS